MHLSVVVAADTVELDHQLRFLGMLLAATVVGTMAVAGGVSWLVVSRGLRPLGVVAHAIAGMNETDLKQRIPRQGVPREIDPVVKQLNGLLARLDEAFERERTLTADVAHELRTPVAEIRTIAEVTLKRERATGEYREALGETLTVARTLQGLIERLLVLARLESGQMRPELRPVALRPLLSEFGMLVQAEAERRGVSFTNGCPSDAIVLADPMLLEVVLSNALFNAATYTPDGGRVEATAQRTGASWRFSIANTGCELKPEEAGRVFDRFWRADAARGKSGLNCGLGLTLVRRAIEAMGGAAEANVTDDRCFVLSLSLPAARDHGEAPPSSERPDVGRSPPG
jgi:signal transduction histidine kinase